MLNLYLSLASERNERLEFLARSLKRLNKPETNLDFVSYANAKLDNSETDYLVTTKLIEEGKYE